VQSLALRHPTHTAGFALVSQMLASIGQSPLLLQAGWHAWSSGQHDGVADGQSPLVAHAAHWPVPATQIGVGWAQLAFDVQSTQPRVGSHCWLLPH
jgi:hypothetical protein